MSLSSFGHRVKKEDRDKTKRKKRIGKWIFVLFLIIIIISSLLFISSSDLLSIRNFDVYGYKLTDGENIENLVEKRINEKFFGLISGKAFGFLPDNKIIQSIKLSDSRIKDVILKRGFNDLKINIIEYEPKALLCIDPNFEIKTPVEIKEDSSCYFIDNSGMVFSSAPLFSRDVYVIFVEKSDLEIKSYPYQYMSNKFFSDLLFVSHELNLEKIQISFIVKDENNIDYKLVSDNGFYVFLSNKNNPRDTLSYLQKFLSYNRQQTGVGFDPVRIYKYLDARFGNSIFYKKIND